MTGCSRESKGYRRIGLTFFFLQVFLRIICSSFLICVVDRRNNRLAGRGLDNPPWVRPTDSLLTPKNWSHQESIANRTIIRTTGYAAYMTSLRIGFKIPLSEEGIIHFHPQNFNFELSSQQGTTGSWWLGFGEVLTFLPPLYFFQNSVKGFLDQLNL